MHRSRVNLRLTRALVVRQAARFAEGMLLDESRYVLGIHRHDVAPKLPRVMAYTPFLPALRRHARLVMSLPTLRMLAKNWTLTGACWRRTTVELRQAGDKPHALATQCELLQRASPATRLFRGTREPSIGPRDFLGAPHLLPAQGFYLCQGMTTQTLRNQGSR